MDRRTRAVLSSFYFAHFAALGLFIPFFSIYARSLGFSATRIGLLLATLPLAKAVLPSFWGVAADRTGARRTILIASNWCACVVFAGFLVVESYPACFLLMVVYAALSVPALPFVEATTLETIEATGADYGRIRVNGSIGFALSSFLFGWLAPGGAPFAVVPTHLVLLAGAAVAASFVPPPRPAPQARAGEARRVISRLPVALILTTGFLMQASHGAYVGFFSLVLRESGYPTWVVGTAWAGSILSEVAVLVLAATLIRRLGLRRLLAFSVGIAVLRWTLYATTISGPALVLGQAMHGFTYAGFHVAAINTVHRLFPAEARSTGQAIYSGWTYGAGLMIGTSLAGLVKDLAGNRAMFGVETALAIGALVLIALGAARGDSGGQGGTAPVPAGALDRRPGPPPARR